MHQSSELNDCNKCVPMTAIADCHNFAIPYTCINLQNWMTVQRMNTNATTSVDIAVSVVAATADVAVAAAPVMLCRAVEHPIMNSPWMHDASLHHL